MHNKKVKWVVHPQNKILSWFNQLNFAQNLCELGRMSMRLLYCN